MTPEGLHTPPTARIKVLHIIKTLNLGGAESNLYNLVKFSDKSALDIHVAYSEGGAYQGLFESEHIKLFRFASKAYKVKDIYSLIIVWRLFFYMLRHRIQIVHTHNYNAHAWGAVAAKLAGIKVIEHVHDPRYEPNEFLVSRQLPMTQQYNQAELFARCSDCIVVLTRANENFLLNKKIVSSSKVRRFLNGIDLSPKTWDPREKILKKFDIPGSAKIVVSAMRLAPEKNADLIIDIAQLIHAKAPDAVFLIAGDGPDQTALQERVRSLNLSKQVRLIGFYPYVQELLSVSDLFLLPTLRELHSVSMIEAMSMNVPVLVSEGAGCNDEFIKNRYDGFVLNPLTPQPWADTILDLLADDDLRKNIGKRGRSKVEQECDIRQVARRFERLYEEILSNN